MTWTNLIIGYQNFAALTGVAISTSTAAANRAGSNTVNDQRTSTWQATVGTANQSIMFDLGSSKAADLIVTFDPNNIDGSGAVAFSVSNNGAVWGDPANVNWITLPAAYGINALGFRRMNAAAALPSLPNRSYAYFIDPITPFRYWMLKLTTAVGGGDTYISTGKIYIGPFFTAAKNWAFPFPVSPSDLSTEFSTPYGSSGGKRRPTRAMGTFSIPFTTSAEKTNIQTIVDAVGCHTPVVLMFDRDNSYARRTFFARFTKPPHFQREADETYSYTFDWQEEV